MRYAHLADLHLGSWRDPKMRDLSTNAFLTALDQCLEQKVDFILLAGDLFNTSLPALDTLKIVTQKLKELQEKNIPLYIIAGSHDFSPSGKTMLNVLEKAGLMINVCQGSVHQETKRLHLHFTTDPKTGVKITGILGRKGLLDRTYYENLALTELEQEPGYKIFMFHTTLTELKPKHLEKLESQPVSFLPKGFDYYAGGHIHHPTKIELPEYGTLTYPGALFPNNFAEMEKYGQGGYYLIEVNKGVLSQILPQVQQKISWIPVETVKHLPVTFNCSHQSPEVISFDIMNYFNEQDLTQALIMIRLIGTLEKGKSSDINFKEIFSQLYSRGAYFIMKNTTQLHSEEFEEVKTAHSNPEIVEEEIIKEHLQQIKLFDKDTELQLTKNIFAALNTSKKEGETITNFQERIKSEMNRLLKF